MTIKNKDNNRIKNKNQNYICDNPRKKKWKQVQSGPFPNKCCFQLEEK